MTAEVGYEVCRADRSGLRVVWAESPGPVTATLLFRVGRADETLPTHGISHLVEHLALWPMRDATYAYNGWVEDSVTGFHAAGSMQEVSDFLRRVSDSLRAGSADRLSTERRVLKAEGAARGVNEYSRLLALRFGPAGYGLGHSAEFGVNWLGEAEIAEWSRERFTSGNAVLWISGPPPDDLELRLSAGGPIPAPAPKPIASLSLPAEFVGSAEGIALTMLGERTAALHAALGIASARARKALREHAGLSYAPNGTYQSLDGWSVHLMLAADCRRPDAASVRSVLVSILDDLAVSGPTEDELDRDRQMLARWALDAGDRMSRLDWVARELLHGRVPASGADLVRERQELTPERVADALATAMSTLLAVVSPGAGNDRSRPIGPYKPQEPEISGGDRFVTSSQWRTFKVQLELTIAEHGFAYSVDYVEKTLRSPRRVAIAFANCVAGVRLPSGGLLVIADDGAWVTLHADRLANGAVAVRRIESALGEALLVPLSDREREVAEFVATSIGVVEVGKVAGELDMLPAALGEHEQLRLAASARRLDQALAEGGRGHQTGLVALTNEYFVFLFRGPRGPEIFRAPLGSGTRVTVKGALKKRFIVEHDGVTTTFDRITPAERLARLTQLIGADTP